MGGPAGMLMPAIARGDRVIKFTGDYTFEGNVVSAFHKIAGQPRFVVENAAGILHIFSEAQLRHYKCSGFDRYQGLRRPTCGCKFCEVKYLETQARK